MGRQPAFPAPPGQLADLIDDLVLGDGDILPVNIIIDDLFYPTQNPFEFDEVSEATERARGDKCAAHQCGR